MIVLRNKTFGEVKRRNKINKKSWEQIEAALKYKKERGSLDEAAKKIFATMDPKTRELAESNYRLLNPEKGPDQQLYRFRQANADNSGNYNLVRDKLQDKQDKKVEKDPTRKDAKRAKNLKAVKPKKKLTQYDNLGNNLKAQSISEQKGNLFGFKDKINWKKVGKAGLGVAAAAGLGYGAKKLYDKKKEKEKENPKDKSFSRRYGLHPSMKKEDDKNFDKEIRLHRKWDRAFDTTLTGMGSAAVGTIGGGMVGISKGKGKKGAIIGATAASIAGLGTRKLYRKVNKSKEKEDAEDNEVSQKFSRLKSTTDRFNVGIGIENELALGEGHKAYKKVVDRITQDRENKNKDK